MPSRVNARASGLDFPVSLYGQATMPRAADPSPCLHPSPPPPPNSQLLISLCPEPTKITTKILNRCPAEGEAVLNLDAYDFGNFLVHPLLRTADLPSGEFEFRREGTALDVELGRATFTGVWQGQPVVMEACQHER